jgi:hypothetical protein
MPFSHVWYRVNKQEVPFNVVWLSVSVAFVMALTVCPCATSHLSASCTATQMYVPCMHVTV